MNGSRHINIPIFVPHMGCPHACIFCDQKKISGTLTKQSPELAKDILKDSFSTIEDNSVVEIAFFGGSFTAIPKDEMISYLELTKPYMETGKASGIRLSTRPDAITPAILDILNEYGVTAIELGVQSLDEEVLRESQRGHGIEDVLVACELIKERKISLGVQTMLGLPKDNFQKSLATAKRVIELKPNMIRIYPALVLKNTVLADYYLKGGYTPLTVNEAVEWCADILPLYTESGITVLRVGLQGSDTLEDAIIAGPYHPAFGELVESRILYNQIVKELDKSLLIDSNKGSKDEKKVTIITNPKLISKIIGQKRANIKAIKERYGLDNIAVKADPEQDGFDIKKGCSLGT